MKPLFFMMIFFLGVFQVFPQSDSSSDRAIEFSIGGGLRMSLCIDIYVGQNDSTNFNELVWPTPISIGVSFPVTFAYYISKNIGLGINYTGVFSVIPFYYYQKYIILENYNLIKFTNKIGNLNKGRFLLLEYGLVMLGRYYFDINGDYFSNSLLGPHLWVGSEFGSPNINFSFTIGYYSEFLILAHRNTRQMYSQVNEYVINIGIEMRWRYNIFYQLK